MSIGSTSVNKSLAISTLVSRIFPQGTQILYRDPPVSPEWPAVPDMPQDLFAATALLLETAGAYHYFVPNDVPDNWLTQAPTFVGETDHLSWIDAGREWSMRPTIPAVVRKLWADLGKSGHRPVYVEHKPQATPEPWWLPALALLIIADEACADLGYGNTRQFDSSTEGSSWIFNAWFAPQRSVYDQLLAKAQDEKKTHITFYPQYASVCQLADADMVCVQPKSRTPAVGCTMRALSHNLAMLPPRGVVRACWQRPPQTLKPDDAAALNLLLIPYPFEVSAQWFKGDVRLPPSDAGPQATRDAKPWGWFELHQHWLNGPRGLEKRKLKDERSRRRGALIEFVQDLIEKSMADVGDLHGIVFPEYALDWETYEVLADAIAEKFPSLEFMVSGSSTNCKREAANIALSSVFTRGKNDISDTSITISTSRTKHHRWRLDESQISTYALASALDPRITWWEKSLIPKREIHVNVFREASTFATMICEDLARVDPCHAVLRSVAPSLVFVLLMDGPQLAARWPSRYATVLADDPGSSVLTFTSLGLIERANRTAKRQTSRAVALWKEDTGLTEELSCPVGHHGIVLTLSGYRTTEITMDGRPNRDGRAWRFHGQQPVKYSGGTGRRDEVLRLVTSMT